MITPIFAILGNGKKYKQVMADATYVAGVVKEDSEFYDQKITKKQIGINARVGGKARCIWFDDLTLMDSKELKSIKPKMLSCLIQKDLSNDNITFFMMDRGLLLQDRKTLSPKALELVKLWSR